MHAESPRFQCGTFDRQRVAALAAHALADGIVLVADGADRLVGMAVGLVMQRPWDEVLMATDLVIYVTPEARGGTAFLRLVRAFETLAVELGAQEIVLGVSTGIATEHTVGMYQRLGYSRASIGVIKHVHAGLPG